MRSQRGPGRPPREPTTHVGRVIRSAREKRGWTQEVLAERLGCTDTAVSDWERGSRLHVDPAFALQLVRLFPELDYETLAGPRDRFAKTLPEPLPGIVRKAEGQGGRHAYLDERSLHDIRSRAPTTVPNVRELVSEALLPLRTFLAEGGEDASCARAALDRARECIERGETQKAFGLLDELMAPYRFALAQALLAHGEIEAAIVQLELVEGPLRCPAQAQLVRLRGLPSEPSPSDPSDSP